MIRNLKALGISLVAMFAMSALGASTASAVDVVTTGASPAILTGIGHDHVFKLTNADGTKELAKFECTTSKFASTVKSGDSEITADVEYEKKVVTPHNLDKDCTSSLGEALVTTTGCAYILTGNTTAEHPLGGGKFDAPVWIECETGKQIIVKNTSPEVTLSIPAQTPTAGGVTYTNKTGGKVEVTATVTGVTFNCAPTFTCTLGGIPHHGNNTDYNGTVVMSAFEDVNGLPTPVTEGGSVSVSSS